jgi:hypothetical protein
MIASLHSLAAAGGDAPAAGAAVDQIAIATVAATVVTVTMLWLAVGHRNGRIRWIGRLAAHGERVSGLPGWAVVPSAIVGVSLLIALFGMYWDISLHIDNGRDAGPLANPAHYFILFGLFGVLFAAVAAIALPMRSIGRTGVRIAPGWAAPTGGIVLLLCAAFALAGFPLDDVWHRLFGQDVTLWGPTHLMLIGGASLATIGALVLTSEGLTARGAGGAAREPTPIQRRMQRVRTGLLAGGLLVALSTLQGEFDFGVPQFRLLFHPLLIAVAASVALVIARISLGRGGALAAVASFLVMRGALALLVGPILGQTMPHFPLYLAEALVVELVAWRVGRDRPLLLGAVSGLGIGTIGLASEWGWSHVFMPLAWPSELMGEAFVAGTLVAVAGGVLGGWIGAAVTPSVPLPRVAGRAAFAGFVVILAAVAWTLPIGAGDGTRATVTLRELRGGPERTVAATARLEPPDAAAGADWFVQTSWQGGGSVIEPMREVAAGVWRTTAPMPVHGDWKSELRLHTGNDIVGLPVYFPADPAIPAPAVAAPDRFTRTFVLDKQLLQREQKGGVPGWLTTFAYLAVLAIALAMAAALAWALRRLRREPGDGPRFDRQPSIRARSRSASAASSS